MSDFGKASTEKLRGALNMKKQESNFDKMSKLNLNYVFLKGSK